MQKLGLIILPAIWVIAIAIISVQNATPISIRFLAFRSVELPFGVVLSLCVAGGMVAAGLLISLLGIRRSA
ncbi:MAG: DUF1049 domain-containing protein [Leptolyngbya sp. SIO1D8]|nr:DUF1049 domain-containing protein [Leptolyngbya sp. SIO1D8]